jgi:hypothetical protein
VTREHRKTIVLAVIAAVLLFVEILPLPTLSVRVDLPPAGQPVAQPVPATAGSTTALGVGALALVLLIVTVVMIVWVVRRCIRHIRDVKKPNPADVF